MSIIFVLIPVSLLLLGIALAAFFWAVRSGQFDDLETPGWRVLLGDEGRAEQSSEVRHNTPGTEDAESRPQ